jgi:hypothetical protein
MCGDTLPLAALQAHIATHMEEIALFVLPMPLRDDNSGENDIAEDDAGADNAEDVNDGIASFRSLRTPDLVHQREVTPQSQDEDEMASSCPPEDVIGLWRCSECEHTNDPFGDPPKCEGCGHQRCDDCKPVE